ncbi:8825_t:CDS:2, partial [Paraglomus occultum]
MEHHRQIDPFAARMAFLALLKKLNASQLSIQKAVKFALRHRHRYEDLFACIMEILMELSVYSRLNILYLLDSLCENAFQMNMQEYKELIEKNLVKIIQMIAPENSQGEMNSHSAYKVLMSWKSKEILALQPIEDSLLWLKNRQIVDEEEELEELSRTDMLRRIEDDRERSKRHREDMWVRIGTDQVEKEFDEMWETCSNLDDKDYFVMITENMRYMPNYPWTEELLEIKAWEEKQK